MGGRRRLGSLVAMPLPRPVRVALGLCVLGALSIAASVGGAAAWASNSSEGRLKTIAGVEPHDVAIVLGAEVLSDGTPAKFTAARLDIAIKLYKAGKAKVLVVSGNNSAEHHRETTNMRRYLVARGVPSAKIVEDAAGNDTYDTCIRARDTFGITSTILVSQTYHLPRAITACRSLGVDAVGVGDSSVAKLRFWRTGVLREYPANVKLALDVLRGAGPEVAEPPSRAVADALGR